MLCDALKSCSVRACIAQCKKALYSVYTIHCFVSFGHVQLSTLNTSGEANVHRDAIAQESNPVQYCALQRFAVIYCADFSSFIMQTAVLRLGCVWGPSLAVVLV